MSITDRKNPRALVRLPAQLTLDQKKIDCVILDLSVSGVRLQVPKSIDISAAVEIEIQILPDIPPMRFRIHCVWKRGSLAGLDFQNISHRNAVVLQSLVKIHRAELIAA